MKGKKVLTPAQEQLESAIRMQNYHLETAEISRASVRRQEELAAEAGLDVQYWQRIVDLELGSC